MAKKNVKIVNKTIKEDKMEKLNSKNAGLMIPAGLLLGMGLGFALNNVPAGLFIGLGVGFFLFAIIKIKTN